MKTKNLPKAASHGECQIVETSIPAQAKPFHPEMPLKLADSETTGNHHLLDAPEGCEFYELDGVRYMRTPEPATVRCVLPDRHDSIEIPAGEWEFSIAQEYDYLAQAARNVAD